MKEVATIKFTDDFTKEEALAVIRADSDRAVLCLSHKSGGDIEVCMTKDEAKRVAEALQRSLA
jgi:hypothetical protein